MPSKMALAAMNAAHRALIAASFGRLAGAPDSERSQVESAAFQDQPGCDMPESWSETVVAGVPETTTVAWSAVRAKWNCSGGDALWPSSAWFQNVVGVPKTLWGAARTFERANPEAPASWLRVWTAAALSASTNLG